MRTLDEILRRIEKNGGPTPITPQEELRRNRLIQASLRDKIFSVYETETGIRLEELSEINSKTAREVFACAEARFPGIEHALDHLLFREEALLKIVGEA